MAEPAHYVLTLSCPDAHGIVYATSGFLVAQNCNVTESQQFGDPESRRFFLRMGFSCSDAGTDVASLRGEFAGTAADLGMDWQLADASVRPRAVIMVSKLGHCLNDLLFRHSIGALPMDIVAVVSNHRDFAQVAGQAGLPFRHIPVTPETKAGAESQLLDLLDSERVDMVVLARYMQILTDAVCRRMPGRIINIHHSLLPSFSGADPYRQAHARGVKLVGATAHYVTADLDEGPIIEQDVARVDHSADPAHLAAAGRDVECQVLARAVRWHTESRVLLNGHRTVVFRA